MIDYFSYWGLKKAPFQDENNPKFYFFSKEHYEAFERIRYSLDSDSINIALLCGEIGAGKTITKFVLMKELRQRRRQPFLVNIDSTFFSFLEILLEIVSQLTGVNPETLPQNKYFLLIRLKEFIRENIPQQGKHIYLFFDEAQKISNEDLDLIKDLTNITNDGIAPIKIILIAQPELMERIKQLPQVDSRIGIRYHLGLMDFDDTKNYINYRLLKAASQQEIFTKEAKKVIYLRTNGNPRKINRACKVAMDLAASEKMKHITDDLMNITFDDLG